jgi:hypothetical protein
MLRAMATFLLLFFFLSLVVHLSGMSELFGVAALTVFAIDLAFAHLAKSPRPVKMGREPLL